MFTRIKFFSAILSLALFAAIGMLGFAQQPQNQGQNQSPNAGGPQHPFGHGQGRGFGHGPGPGGAFGPGVMRELNLTDDQKQQIRTIVQANFESAKAQREELRQLMQKRFQGTLTADDEARAKTLHEQMQASMQDTQSKIAAVLTPEQKAKLEELMKQRKDNRGRFGGRHGRPGDGSPPPKPTNPPNNP